jgi:MFS family permease
MDAIAAAAKVKRLTHGETRLIVLGMLLPIFMGSLDQTILASALPTIGRDLGDAHDLPWLITAYLLASTAIIPLYGKIADIRGRAFALRIAIALHLAGSLLCALAPSMLVLILGRSLQGLGGGGLASMGVVVLGDVAAPRERGRYYSYFAVTYTTAGACGPALGGFLADHLRWSAIFWINIPLGLAALAVTSTLLRGLPRHERPHRLDVIGAILIVAASVSFMLGLNLAGVRFAGTAPLAEPASLTTTQAFAWVFYADAGCIAIALFAVALMAERPLQEEP